MERRANVSVGGPLTNSSGWHWNPMGRLWLPTEYEVNGADIWGNPNGMGTNVQYPIFRDGIKTKWLWVADNKHSLNYDLSDVKNTDSHKGGRAYWWLATVGKDSANAACDIPYHGNADRQIVNGTEYHVPVCFRIAKST